MYDYGPMANGYGLMKNKDKAALDRWTKPGDVTSIPKAAVSSSAASYTAFRNYYRYSDAVWGDASFIRLKNVSLSYDLSDLTGRWKISSSSIYFQGQNLFTITNYRGLDPETKGFDRDFVSQVNPFGSVKPLALPVLRSYTIGLRFGL